MRRLIDCFARVLRGGTLRAFGALLIALCLLPTSALAADRLTELAAKLRGDKDFRVRTQAALALGVSQSERAVAPLCSGLDDEDQTVRAASAAALGKLRRGGLECITRRMGVEQHPKVKEMLTKVLLRLKQPLPTIGPDTRYYVAVGPTTNKTPGADEEVENLVREALYKELAKDKTLAVAPSDETPDQATVLLAKDKTLAVAPSDETPDQATVLLAKHKTIKPVFIWPKLQATDEAGAVNFKLSFTLFSYPDKAFKGALTQSAKMPGGRSNDLKVLEELVDAAAPLIVAKFVANVGKLE